MSKVKMQQDIEIYMNNMKCNKCNIKYNKLQCNIKYNTVGDCCTVVIR